MDTESFVARHDELDELHARGDYEAAYTLVRELLREQPHSADLLVRTARLEQLLDRDDPAGDVSIDSARAHLLRAHRLEPSAPAPLLELGHLSYAVDNDVESGLRHFEAARELSESLLREAWTGQIRCLTELGRLPRAREELAALRGCLGSDLDLDDLEDAVVGADPVERGSG